MTKQTVVKIIKIAVLVLALLFAVTVAGTTAAYRWEIQINQYLNIRTSDVGGGEILFESDYDEIEDLLAAKQSLIETLVGEGCVLLKNENDALPVAKDSNVSLFGRGSFETAYGAASGGSNIQMECDDMKTVFESSGLNVNPTLWDFYENDVGGRRYSNTTAIQLAEATAEDFAAAEDKLAASYEEYGDAVFITLTRAFGEGFDAPMDPSHIRDGDGEHYALQIQDVERNMIAEAKKAAGADGKVIVLLNSDNPMEIGELKDDPDIDAILWIGGPGVWGLYGVADVITGEKSPSGHLSDTYAYDNFSAPAMQNFGDFRWTNADSVGSAEGARTYVVYEEGVYVGYKYYETRYEDVVLGQGNADTATGAFASTDNWDYNEEVCYPFGYGLSYTTFSRTLDALEWDEENETVTATVTVKNTGDVAGKEVVQLYVNTPYTQYDIDNKVEKPSVKLVGFEKTDTLEPGGEQTLTVSARLELVASYDYTKAKTYILDSGTYYFAVGNGAHDAMNNVLAAKGKTTADGMDYNGDTAQVKTYEKTGEVDTETCSVSDHSDTKITNTLDSANINYYDGQDVTYLSRNDWSGTWSDGADGLTATAEMIEDFAIGASDQETEATITADDIVSGVSYDSDATSWTFKDLYGKEYDDPIWEELISQMSLEDICMSVAVRNSGALDSIEMPQYMQFDGPAGIYGVYQTDKMEYATYAVMYNSTVLTASTFNKELVREEGRMFGNDGIWTGFQSVWGPGFNTHRTALSGRNVEYYSEDGVHAYYCGIEFSKGTMEYGLSTGPKHFAFNDMETNRGGIATFVNEQAARELYLRAFEGPLAAGEALDTMVGKNRLGCFYIGAHKGFLTDLVRGEWGYLGKIVSDSSGGGYADGTASVKAGLSQMDTADTRAYYEDTLSPTAIVRDPALFECMIDAVHHNFWLWSHTSLMNGLIGGEYSSVTPWYQTLLIALDVIFGALALGGVAATVVMTRKKSAEKEA